MNEENKKLETAGNIRRNPERFIFYETETAEQIRGTPEKTTSLNMEKNGISDQESSLDLPKHLDQTWNIKGDLKLE